jgi:hypothetical protein
VEGDSFSNLLRQKQIWEKRIQNMSFLIYPQPELGTTPLINGIALSFHFENINLTEERLFLNLRKASALKILFCRTLKLDVFNALIFL